MKHINTSGTNYSVICHNISVLLGESDSFYFAVKSFSPVGIDKIQTDMADIFMYFNPASDKMNIYFTKIAAGKITVVIYYATGKQVAVQY